MILLLALMPQPALAWRHTGQQWADSDFRVCLIDHGVEPDAVAEARAAIASWDAALVARGLGTLTESFDCEADGTLVLELGIAKTGLAPDRTGPPIGACEYDELLLYRKAILPLQDYATHEEIEAGQCDGGLGLQNLAAHQIGHGLGLDHSCEPGDLCNDPAWIGALMYYTSPACSALVGPTDDDLAGLEALYGPEPSCDPRHAPDPVDTGEAQTGTEDPGCGCAQDPGSSPWWGLGMLAILGRRRRVG